MTLDPPGAPLRYQPDVEHPEEDEAKTAREIVETMGSISDKTYADTGQALRSVHAKSHGIVKAVFEVLPDLPPVLAQGLFAAPGQYGAVMRLSTVPGDILPDSIATPRGVALKVLDVPGARLEGSEDDTCQDFIGVNGKQFQAPSGKAFLSSLKPLAKTTDRVEGLKHVAATLARGAEAILETVGGESATLRALGGEAEHHILGETFFGQLPVRYGDYIAKFSVVPVSPSLTALTGAAIGEDGDDALREAVAKFFAGETAAWEFRVQLCIDPEAMPIEDATKPWDEEKSGFFTVARISAARQATWSAGRVGMDTALGFSPWRGVEAHRPLGAIMRMRKSAYAAMQKARGARNGAGILQPRTLDEIAD
ncbi:hypothetical protein sos41_32680 [Alphaproteobacteria bacterium SO-S41]|nr:hypothetical protein sos41_32680 [Alphaproteobacteria bacterium SO-S41]